MSTSTTRVTTTVVYGSRTSTIETKKSTQRLIAESANIAYALTIAQEMGEEGEAQNYYKAISSDDSTKWITAMQEEVESLLKYETWEFVNLPEGKQVISCKWIFKRKEGIPGVESTRNKERFFVRGFDQEEGIDFNEVFFSCCSLYFNTYITCFSCLV